MARLVLDRVSKRFRGEGGAIVRAVGSVSLTVEPGEWLVLVGPSGCGKTTLLRLVAGLEDPDAGAISLDGRPLAGVAPAQREAAMVFQNQALYPHLSVYENIALGLRIRKRPAAEIAARVGETLTLLGLDDCATRLPREISGGQAQRTALGRALVRRPKLFLLDEPLAGLDASLRGQLRAELGSLRRRLGVTTILVTHDQEEAMMLGRRIAVMREGLIEQVATPLELYRQPASRFVAGFFGSPPMTFLEGVFEQEGGVLRFQAVAAPVRLVPGGSVAATVAGFAGRRVVLGVRPEHVSLVPAGASPGHLGAIPVTVDLVQPAGADFWLHASIGACRLTARCAGSGPVPEPGPAWFLPDLDRLSFFDPASGASLATPPRPADGGGPG